MLKWLLFLMAALPMMATADEPDNFERCMNNVLAKKPGQVMKVEFKLEDEQQVYEFNVRGFDGHDWDLECHKATGEILELEQEVMHPNDPSFKANVKFNEQEARDVALAAYPGRIIEVEYEIEANGNSSYEFDIDTFKGQEIKVEIDAASGEIIEVNQELWQVGLE